MTPDKAGDLLAGTTPGPWEVDHDHAWEPGVWSPDGIVFGPYYDREDMEQWEAGNAADLALAAAAPALAAMIAGMREEWRAELQGAEGGWHVLPDHKGREWGGREWAGAIAAQWHSDGFRVRLVPRYVTEPEEA